MNDLRFYLSINTCTASCISLANNPWLVPGSVLTRRNYGDDRYMGQQMWPLAAIDHRLDSIPMCRDGHCGVTCRSLSPLDTRSSSIYVQLSVSLSLALFSLSSPLVSFTNNKTDSCPSVSASDLYTASGRRTANASSSYIVRRSLSLRQHHRVADMFRELLGSLTWKRRRKTR